MLTRRLRILACLLLGVAGPTVGDQPSFQGLGNLPGGASSEAYGISGDGTVVVGWSRSASGADAFRWSLDTGMQGLGELPPGWSQSRAYAVSTDGSVIAGAGFSALGLESFQWTSVGGVVPIAGGESSVALGTSGDGSVIVGYSFPSLGTQAFRWTQATGMVSLGLLPGGSSFSHAYGVSADGNVIVGGSSSAAGYEAFQWTSDTGMVGLGDLPGGEYNSRASAASSDGSVIVGFSDSASGRQAFRWTQSTGMVGLKDIWAEVSGLDGFASEANAVSADGSIIVGAGLISFTPNPEQPRTSTAFIWDATNGMRELQDVLTTDYGLDLNGWHLQEARGVSADGRTIVGWGTNPTGGVEAWIAIIPEPACLVFISLGATFVLRRKRAAPLT